VYQRRCSQAGMPPGACLGPQAASRGLLGPIVYRSYIVI